MIIILRQAMHNFIQFKKYYKLFQRCKVYGFCKIVIFIVIYKWVFQQRKSFLVLLGKEHSLQSQKVSRSFVFASLMENRSVLQNKLLKMIPNILPSSNRYIMGNFYKHQLYASLLILIREKYLQFLLLSSVVKQTT
jgi:hypothetical protein